MNDFKQRILDWKQYRKDNIWHFRLKDVTLDGPRLRSIWWFLLQPVEKRRRREIEEPEEEIRALKKLIEEYDAKYNKKNK